MLVHLRRSIVASIVLFMICGLAYPLLETGVAQLFFKSQANGSLVTLGRTVIGSSALGQRWTGPKWFEGRPDTDNPMSSGAQNYGPRSELLLHFSERQVALLRRDGVTPTNDLVTGSGSGLDPDIAPVDAYAQVATVARANRLSPPRLRSLVTAHVVDAYWGFLGAPYVNVLELNLALEKLAGTGRAASLG